MLKSLAASTALKYALACVCPVAGTAALTLAAPKVRAAVHKMTEPRKARAKPRVRVKPAAPLSLVDAAGLDCRPAGARFVGVPQSDATETPGVQAGAADN
jgi:hypothetical protein